MCLFPVVVYAQCVMNFFPEIGLMQKNEACRYLRNHRGGLVRYIITLPLPGACL